MKNEINKSKVSVDYLTLYSEAYTRDFTEACFAEAFLKISAAWTYRLLDILPQTRGKLTYFLLHRKNFS